MKNKLSKFATVLSVSVFYPMVSFAQASSGCFAQTLGADKKIGGLLSYVTCLIQTAFIPLIFALTIAMFVWGVAQFIIHSDDEAKKESAKQLMIWGIIGLTVMMGVWGLVRIVGGTFDLNTSVLPSVKPN